MTIRTLVLTTAALAVGASPALAAKGATYATTVSPSQSGTTSKPRNAGLRTVVTIPAPPGGQATFAAKRSVQTIPAGVVLDGRPFPSCTEAQLTARGPDGCPSGSQIGKGRATAAAMGQTGTLEVRLFNAGRGRSILMWANGRTPVPSTLVQPVRLGRAPGSTSGQRLEITLPDEFLQPLPGVYALMTKIDLTLRATRKGRGYVRTTSCRGEAWAFTADLTYTDGDRDRVSSRSRCR